MELGVTMSATAGPPIVCFSAVDWDYLTMREHQLLSRLSRYYPVLYVEEQSHLLSLVRSPRKVRKMWQWAEPPRPVAKDMWVYTPPMTLPFGRVMSAVNVLNQWILTRQVGKAARALGFARPILWLYEPEQYRQVGRFGEQLVVYDCADKHDAFVRLQRPALVRQMEAILCDRADIIFTVSDALKDAIGPARSHLVPNGADLTLFRRTLNAGTSVADELASMPRPILGYIGTIDSRVDVELLAHAAKVLPQHLFVLVGLVQTDIGRLAALPNVRLLGRRPYQLLPTYLKGFDACLLPFRLTSLTIAGSPIKLYDYLAAGRMVVATDIPEARRFHVGVLIARSREEFVQRIQEALSAGPSHQEISAQMELESWDERASTIHRILEDRLASNRTRATS